MVTPQAHPKLTGNEYRVRNHGRERNNPREGKTNQKTWVEKTDMA
jgi:hypothetical protein